MRVILGVTAVLLAAIVSWCFHHINAPRVVGRVVAPNGAEMCIVQECNWSSEPFTTSFVYRKPGGQWGRHYYDHQDWYWGSSPAVIDTNAERVVFYRGGSPAVSFNWSNEVYVLHRWNRTNTAGQWVMPPGWSPAMPVREQ